MARIFRLAIRRRVVKFMATIYDCGVFLQIVKYRVVRRKIRHFALVQLLSKLCSSVGRNFTSGVGGAVWIRIIMAFVISGPKLVVIFSGVEVNDVSGITPVTNRGAVIFRFINDK